MILPSSIPSIPAGVTIEKLKIVDASLNREHKIDTIGNLFLSKIDGEKSIKIISEELLVEFKNAEYSKIEEDYIQFLLVLNHQHCREIHGSHV